MSASATLQTLLDQLARLKTNNQTKAEREAAAKLLTQIKAMARTAQSEVVQLENDLTADQATITAQRAEINRLNARIAELEAPPLPPEGKVLTANTFSGTLTAPGWSVQANPGRASVSNGVGRFEVRQGDPLVAKGNRCEVSGPNFPLGADIWVADVLGLAPDYAGHPSWEILHQMHGVGGSGSPPISLLGYGAGSKYALRHGKGGGPTYWGGAVLTPGQMHQLLYRVVIDHTDGLIEAWWDGVKVVNGWRGQTCEDEGLYPKCGIYRGTDSTEASIAQHAGIAVATTKDAVLAALAA